MPDNDGKRWIAERGLRCSEELGVEEGGRAIG